MTIFDLAIQHMRGCGMSEADATECVEQFGGAEGADIGWADIAPQLSKQQIARIDRAAVAWLFAHRLATREVDRRVERWA